MVDSTKTAIKPRVGVLLRQVGQKSTNLSAELVELQKRYKDMNGNLKKMDKALKQRHAAMIKMEQSRVVVAEVLTSMSMETPLEEEACAGTTYSNAIKQWSTTGQCHAEKFKSFALDYVAQWEQTVSTRVATDTKEADTLRREADHYKTKVESLEKQIKKLGEKDKPVPDATTEKLERNQEKLAQANSAYNKAAESLVSLMKEVVDRSWRDLHPLMIKCLKFDLDVHESEQAVLEPAMKDCVSDLEELATSHDIKDNGRLENIKDDSPQDLLTVAESNGGGSDSDAEDEDEVQEDDVSPSKEEEAAEATPEQPQSTATNAFDE